MSTAYVARDRQRVLLSSAELSAELTAMGLDVSVRTLERWRADQEGPPHLNVQGRIRYHRARVQQWLASCEQGGTPSPTKGGTPPASKGTPRGR